MQNIIDNIKEYFLKYIEDILIFMGLFIIIITTIILNIYIGMYLLGISFLIIGVYMAKFFARR